MVCDRLAARTLSQRKRERRLLFITLVIINGGRPAHWRPDVILFALGHRSSIRSTLPALSFSPSFSRFAEEKKKGKAKESGAAVLWSTWVNAKKKEESGRSWWHFVGKVDCAGIPDRRQWFRFHLRQGSHFSRWTEREGGRWTRSSLIFARHTAGKSFTSISACKNFLPASPLPRFLTTERFVREDRDSIWIRSRSHRFCFE